MGCICSKSNIIIKPLSNIESSVNSNIQMINKNIKSKNSMNDKIIPNSTNGSNRNKKKLNDFSLIENDNIITPNLTNNMEEKRKNKTRNTLVDSKISSSYNIIELISMEKSLNKTLLENKSFVKTYVPSSFKIKKINESKLGSDKKILSINSLIKGGSPIINMYRRYGSENNETILNSINENKEKINLIFFSDFKEKMTEIWFNQGDKIKFTIKTNIKWGIKEKGNCDYKGYDELFNNCKLCCLLMRIGDDENYISIDCNEIYYAKKDGPLFLKMNVDLKYLKDNNYHLEGMLQIEISNAEKLNPYQIFSRCGFDGDINEYEKNEIVYTINIFKKNPKRFCKIFLNTINFNIDENKCSKNSFIINDNLQQISKFILDNNIMEITKKEINLIKDNINKDYSILVNLIENFSKEWLNNSIKEFVFILDNLVPLDIIRKLIEDNKYINYIFDKEFKYIGVSLREDEYSHLSKDYFKCSILISKNFL